MDVIFRHTHASCDFSGAAGIPVSAQEYDTGLPVKAAQEAVDQVFEHRFIFHGYFPIGNALPVFIQKRFHMGISLFGCAVAIAVQRQIPCNAPKEGRQIPGSFRRNGAPGIMPGIIDALLAVLVGEKNAVGNGMAVFAVLLVRFRNRRWIPRPKQVYNSVIIHCVTPYALFKAFHFNRRKTNAKTYRIGVFYFTIPRTVCLCKKDYDILMS